MKRKLIFFALLLFVLAGCNTFGSNNGGLKGNKPPNAFIEINGERFDTKLGTYCWQLEGYGECVDTAGAEHLLIGEEPIQVEAGATVTFVMDYEPMPNEVHLAQTSEDGEIEISVTDHTFTAPDEKGLYYYYYGVWWMDESRENVSNGDAFYAFALLVE